MKAVLKRFIKDERGLETIEYAIMVALIVAGLITIITSVGDKVAAQFTNIDTELTAAP